MSELEPTDPIIDTKTVTVLTGLPGGTLRFYRHANKGPASFVLGKKVVYRLSEVQRWIAEQEQATRRGGSNPEVA